MSWKKGESGNRKGRPRSGMALAEAIRRTVDPEEVVRKLVDIAENSPSEQTKLRALEMLVDRGWKKPAQVLEVGPADPYEDLSDEELAALEAEALVELAQSERAALPEAEIVVDTLEHARTEAPSVRVDLDPGVVEDAARPSPEDASAESCTTQVTPGVLVRRRGPALTR